MDNNTLLNAIKAANVHKKVSKCVYKYIKPGKSLYDIANFIETSILNECDFNINDPLLKGIGFPVGLSINNCAAHYTPNYNENKIILKDTDIIKVDFGVHYEGTIIDSAFTISYNPLYEEFINISKNTTNYAVSLCKPDVILGEIGSDIEEYVKSKEIDINGKIYRLKTMCDLSGHKIAPYEIHAGKAVPNIAINYGQRMLENEFYAIEPFITTGIGLSILKTPNSHYMLNKNCLNSIINNSSEKKLYELIKKNYYTLPFCQKWLYQLDHSMNHDILLEKLTDKKIINVYPPIYDIQNSIISQFEHTIFIKNNGIINLTKNENY